MPKKFEHMGELIPKYDSRKSFYGKAKIEFSGDTAKLYSYGTLVAEIKGNIPVVYSTHSTTTLRHIKEFLKQHNFPAESKSQIIKSYKQR